MRETVEGLKPSICAKLACVISSSAEARSTAPVRTRRGSGLDLDRAARDIYACSNNYCFCILAKYRQNGQSAQLMVNARVGRRGAFAVELDVQAQLIGGVGVADCFIIGNDAVVVEFEQRIVEGAHALLARLAHDLLQVVKFALEQLVGHDGGVEQDFNGGDAAAAVFFAHQALRNDAL